MSEPFRLDLPIRPRRNRKSEGVRGLVREHRLHASQFVLPVFLHEDATDHPIESMPSVTRWSLDGLIAEAGRAWDDGIRAMVLFPKIPDELKTAGVSGDMIRLCVGIEDLGDILEDLGQALN